MNKSCTKYSVFMMCYAIWYHLYNLKNEENTNGGVSLLKSCKLKPATLLLKVTLLHDCFPCFLNCRNGTKTLNASHLLGTDLALMYSVTLANLFFQSIHSLIHSTVILVTDASVAKENKNQLKALRE